MEVNRRIINCIDLVQEDARYHDELNLLVENLLVENLLVEKVSSQQKVRPKNNVQQSNFEILCEWLETEGELYSLVELHDQMKEFPNSDEIYARKWLKTWLKNKYEEQIFLLNFKERQTLYIFEIKRNFY